ncbi:MAG: retropepsin-like aspartic protease [Nitrososphaerota archaeon]
MRSISHHLGRPRPQRTQASVRLFAIVATLFAVALAIGACSLGAVISPGGSGNGLSSNDGSITLGSGQTTPVRILHGGGGAAMVLVPVTIEGHGPYDFALDTGAGITLIDTQLADELQLQVTGDSAPVSGVGGTQNITPVHIGSWKTGKVALPATDAGKTGLSSFKQDSGVRGLLGSDVLSRFGSITINYGTGAQSDSNLPARQSGMAPTRDAGVLAEGVREAMYPRAA